MKVVLENLTKKFPGRGKNAQQEVVAVDDFTFEIPDGKLVGLGSACPYYELDYRGSRADAYYGEALAIVEADTEGTMTLNVSDGKQIATVSVEVQA